MGVLTKMIKDINDRSFISLWEWMSCKCLFYLRHDFNSHNMSVRKKTYAQLQNGMVKRLAGM